MNNTRRSHKIFYKGSILSMLDLERLRGINRSLIRRRIFEKGWSVEDAITIPNKRKKQ